MDEIINRLIRAAVLTPADKVSPVMLAAVHRAHHRHEMNQCKKISPRQSQAKKTISARRF